MLPVAIQIIIEGNIIIVIYASGVLNHAVCHVGLIFGEKLVNYKTITDVYC
jgi:hypothetical protein